MEELLEDGETLLYTERSCAPCQRYLRSLRHCPAEVTSKIRYVSTDPASQAKILARTLPAGTRVYVMKNRKDFTFLKATPTTQTRWGDKRGALSCAELARLQGRGPEGPGAEP